MNEGRRKINGLLPDLNSALMGQSRLVPDDRFSYNE